MPIPVIIQVKPDRTFTFEMKSPPTSWLLMKAAGVEKVVESIERTRW